MIKLKQLLKEAKKKLYPCPKPTKDLKLNTKNRNKAIKADHIKYGPLNVVDRMISSFEMPTSAEFDNITLI